MSWKEVVTCDCCGKEKSGSNKRRASFGELTLSTPFKIPGRKVYSYRRRRRGTSGYKMADLCAACCRKVLALLEKGGK